MVLNILHIASFCCRNACKSETRLHARQHAVRNIFQWQQNVHMVTPILKNGWLHIFAVKQCLRCSLRGWMTATENHYFTGNAFSFHFKLLLFEVVTMCHVSNLSPLNICMSFQLTNFRNSMKNINMIKSLFFMATDAPEFSSTWCE